MGKHYESFRRTLDSGILNETPIEPYLRDISRRARHIISPIEGDQTIAAFGLTREEFGHYIDSFIERALPQGKILPLDELVCVEDEFSAVFVENALGRPRSLRLTIFMNDHKFSPDERLLNSGILELVAYRGADSLYSVTEIFTALIKDGSYEAVTDEDKMGLALAGQDLVNSVNAVIEQIVYMVKIGTFAKAEGSRTEL